MSFRARLALVAAAAVGLAVVVASVVVFVVVRDQLFGQVDEALHAARGRDRDVAAQPEIDERPAPTSRAPHVGVQIDFVQAVRRRRARTCGPTRPTSCR